MNYTRIKKDSEITLNGVKTEVERRDGSAYSLALTDDKGNLLRITSTYGLELYKIAPPATEKKFRLSGEISGLKVNEHFDSQYDATTRRNELDRLAQGTEYEPLKIEEVEVLVQ